MSTIYYPDDFRFYLKSEFESRIKRRPHYSLRAYARDLELSPSTVSDFFNGKLRLSKERVFGLSKKLKLSETQRDHWVDLIEAKYSKNPEARKLSKIRVQARSLESKNRLALEHFQVISEWQHFAILELLEISPRYHSIEKLAKALDLETKIVRQSVERLVKLEMIKIDKIPWTVSSEASVFGGPDVTNKALREFHFQALQKAIAALETQNIEKREAQTIIFGLAKEKIPEMKRELAKMMINFVMKYAESPQTKDSVYCLCSHLFSLTQEESK